MRVKDVSQLSTKDHYAVKSKTERIVLYVSQHRNPDHCMAQIYGTTRAARRFVDALLEDDGWIWEDDCTIRSESGIVVSTRWEPVVMRAIMEREFEVKEMAWQLQPHHVRAAKWFRNPPSIDTEEKAAARLRRKREGRSSGPKTSAPPGYVHVSVLAQMMGIDAKQARVALRKIYAGNKPSCGWNFPPEEVEALKTKIKEVLGC